LAKTKTAEVQNARARLAKTLAEKMTLQTVTFAREINLAKKPEPIYQSLD
jgi:hypothetical protein